MHGLPVFHLPNMAIFVRRHPRHPLADLRVHYCAHRHAFSLANRFCDQRVSQDVVVGPEGVGGGGSSRDGLLTSSVHFGEIAVEALPHFFIVEIH